MSNFEEMRKKYIPTTTIQTVNDPNIMDHMVSYDSQITDTFIDQLKEEYREQKEINKILTENNYESNIKEIETFIVDNKTNVSEQLHSLENIFEDLKKIVCENSELKKQQVEYNDILESEEAKNVATNMKDIKKLKNQMILFLQKNGIHL